MKVLAEVKALKVNEVLPEVQALRVVEVGIETESTTEVKLEEKLKKVEV